MAAEHRDPKLLAALLERIPPAERASAVNTETRQRRGKGWSNGCEDCGKDAKGFCDKHRRAGDTPLHNAVLSGRVETANVLIEAGANVETAHVRTAVLCNDAAMVALFLNEGGVDPYERRDWGDTHEVPLTLFAFVASVGAHHVVRVLPVYDGNVEKARYEEDKVAYNPISVAVIAKSVLTLREMLRHGHHLWAKSTNPMSYGTAFLYVSDKQEEPDAATTVMNLLVIEELARCDSYPRNWEGELDAAGKDVIERYSGSGQLAYNPRLACLAVLPTEDAGRLTRVDVLRRRTRFGRPFTERFALETGAAVLCGAKIGRFDTGLRAFYHEHVLASRLDVDTAGKPIVDKAPAAPSAPAAPVAPASIDVDEDK
jgi:hypothetical protein